MPKKSLQWYDTLPTPSQKSNIRRCVLQYTSEATEQIRLFGMLRIDPMERDGTIPFWYNNRLFVAVLREEFFVVFEDRDLNIKALIALWDCKPIKYLELPFAEYFDHFIHDV